jgi:hypothetical protein
VTARYPGVLAGEVFSALAPVWALVSSCGMPLLSSSAVKKLAGMNLYKRDERIFLLLLSIADSINRSRRIV